MRRTRLRTPHDGDAGLLYVTTNPLTSGYVAVYDSVDQHFDPTFPYAMVCWGHTEVAYETDKAKAAWMARHPTQWCPKCREAQERVTAPPLLKAVQSPVFHIEQAKGKVEKLALVLERRDAESVQTLYEIAMGLEAALIGLSGSASSSAEAPRAATGRARRSRRRS